MITRIEINGFKSFSNFVMEFTPFAVISGANASGKSNLFDALRLLSGLASLDLRSAFSLPDRRGNIDEQFLLYTSEKHVSEMSFVVDVLVKRSIEDNWGGKAEITTPRLRYELVIDRRSNERGFDELFVKKERLFKIRPEEDDWCKRYLGNKHKDIWGSRQADGSAKPYIDTKEKNEKQTITIRQDGRRGGRESVANTINQTVLSSVNSVDFPHVFAMREELRSWNFMQLNPEILREPTKQETNYIDKIGHSGENLAAALFRLKCEDEYNITDVSRALKSFLPEYVGVDVIDDKANKLFIVNLTNIDGKVFTSRVLSEGTLRLLVLCILLVDEQHRGLLCFEYPENGIHPFRIKAMAYLLKDMSMDLEQPDELLRQIIINTHSPELLQEINDMSYSDKRISINEFTR
ncbi:MAG: AAA family ATPase [Prevotellaceae bacterium]|jgi:predicted ATPase|nr:AAA family ATPase [Prevotellaceae bacterium]